MRITFLTQYYPPETGAPQNRLHSLAINLKKQGHFVQVLCAIPNYPKSEIFEEYRNKKYIEEIIDDVPVYRTGIYVSKKKGIVRRLLNYFSFAYTSCRHYRKLPATEILLVESPPLFLSWSAYYIAGKWNSRVIFNVSDLWPESAEKLNIVTNKFLLKLAYYLEKNSYIKSGMVTGQTQGIVNNISQRFPDTKTHWLPNGIDRFVYDEIKPDYSIFEKLGIHNKKVFIYAGIIGYAQALESLVEAAAIVKKQRSDFSLLIIGDGPVKDSLIKLNQDIEAGVNFMPNTPKTEVLSIVAASYGYIVPLKDLEIFKGAIPSKLFDPLALGIPILLGVDGEAKDLFIDKGKSGWYYKPENVDDLVDKINISIDNQEEAEAFGRNGKRYVTKYFDRQNIAKDFILALKEAGVS
jgi:glycosyltransferase involved in cell wall biosynthesis